MPTRTPPIKTTMLGPKRSTNQPSIGTSHVSVNTKMLNATWIAARPQWYLASIGLTNSVHPYCRLAIIAMAMMPSRSWSQRYPGECEGAATSVIGSPLLQERGHLSLFKPYLSEVLAD